MTNSRRAAYMLLTASAERLAGERPQRFARAWAGPSADALRWDSVGLVGLDLVSLFVIVLLHELDVEYPHDDRPPERVCSTLVVEGQPGGGTAMARSVGLPVVIAIKLLLGGELSLTGCLIPTHPAIYGPILERIDRAGLSFKESRTQITKS